MSFAKALRKIDTRSDIIWEILAMHPYTTVKIFDEVFNDKYLPQFFANPNITYEYAISHIPENTELHLTNKLFEYIDQRFIDKLNGSTICNLVAPVKYVGHPAFTEVTLHSATLIASDIPWIITRWGHNSHTMAELSHNWTITWDIIRDNLHLNWDWDHIITNHTISWGTVVNESYIPWDKKLFSYNLNITWEIVVNNPEINWDIEAVMRNTRQVHPSVDCRGLVGYELYAKLEDITYYDPYILVRNANLTWEFIVEHPSIWDDWTSISKKSFITWEIFNNNPSYPWDMYIISSRTFVTPEIIHLRDDWDYAGLVLNPNFTIQDIKSIWPTVPDDTLSLNPNISWGDIVNMKVDWESFITFYNLMDQPYYRSKKHHKKLASELMRCCWEELISVACRPSRILEWN